MAPGICSCAEGWLGGACHMGEYKLFLKTDNVLLCTFDETGLKNNRGVSDVRSRVMTRFFSLFSFVCSCMQSALLARREVRFPQQMSLSTSFLWTSLRGEEKVPLVHPRIKQCCGGDYVFILGRSSFYSNCVEKMDVATMMSPLKLVKTCLGSFKNRLETP